MNDKAISGTKIRFTGDNVGVYTENEAKKVLKVGEIYEVESVIISSFFTYVKIKGFKEKFAAEMFEDVV